MALLRLPIAYEFETEVYGHGVVLRPPAVSDFEVWAALRSASRDHLMPFEPQWSRDELTRSAFRRRVRQYALESRSDTGYAFFLRETARDALIGGLTLSNVRRGVAQAASMGYWIGAGYQSRGLMTEAVRAALPFAFETLRLHRLEAACLETNVASRRVLEKSGFRQEGVARRYLKIDGRWQDHVLYAILEDDPRVEALRVI
jgi:[ribosomal protein S5]-alanine N-acetyltransferase